jgi:hypothetical protein
VPVGRWRGDDGGGTEARVSGEGEGGLTEHESMRQKKADGEKIPYQMTSDDAADLVRRQTVGRK